jgi:hypothetical protein
MMMFCRSAKEGLLERKGSKQGAGLAFLEIVQDRNVVLVAQPFGDLGGEGGFLDSGHSDWISALYLGGKTGL